LLARRDHVVGLDSIHPYYDPDRKRANLADIRGEAGSRFTFAQVDIRDKAHVVDLFARHEIECVIHLAALAGVRASIECPGQYYDVNVNGTLILLDAARGRTARNFVFGSTSSVYGQTAQIPFLEIDPCDRPLAPYAASKRAAEMLGFTFHHLYGQNFTALRFFTVYGPRNRPDMMAHKIADSIRTGRPVPIFNQGQMYRDWTYVADIVEGVLAAVDRPLGYEIINLGRGQPVLLADFVQLLTKLAGKQAHLTPAPMPDTDIITTWADTSKAEKLLGYRAKVSVEAGVAHFWKWYEQTFGVEV
jgi:UDP-glucuronate 4-epimerase